MIGDKKKLNKLREGIEIITQSCANCGHPRVRHLKTTPRDEQRANPLTIKRQDSNCKDCSCKQFKLKK